MRKPGRRFEWYTDIYGDKHEIRVDPATGEFFAKVEDETERMNDLKALRKWIDQTVEEKRQAEWEPVIIVYAAGSTWSTTRSQPAYKIELRRFYRAKNKSGEYHYRQFVPKCRYFLCPWQQEDHPGEDHPDWSRGIGDRAAFPRRGCWPHAPGPTCSPYIPSYADVLPYSHDTWLRLEKLRLFLKHIHKQIPRLLGDNLSRTLKILKTHEPLQLLK